MYNRYIPEEASYTRIEPSSAQSGPLPGAQPRRQSIRFFDLLPGKESLSSLLGGREGGGHRSALLKNFDSGDILLLLILLYLLVEGDDLDLVIALGLVLLMGIGEDREE